MDRCFLRGTTAGEKPRVSPPREGVSGPSPEMRRSPQALSTGLLDARRQLLHEVVDVAVLADELGDLRRRVDDGRVIATAEVLPDLRERAGRQLAAEVHGHLPW